ncbi:2-aminoethylphosphonate ABC transporter permease subunit [Microbacterium sp. W1N]|uniref:2-aminoethylphosphonate ABC transporter permease subunit n=1 Tax=Microbacterium festucae TaxID=2977531 RepID=UPI0021BE686E|nr:2-aminoethylphosphonate ABC transporter permease subunit [Microbacterium festucae]MCT9820499.1 2-aminoethylphosphonate ABC transporter permease subunit [Microbacterium festucae]
MTLLEEATQTPPARRRAPRRPLAAVVAMIPITLLVVLVVYPLLLVVVHAFEGEDGGFSVDMWGVLFANPVFTDTIWTTLRIAAISTAIALVLGTFVAIVISYVPFRGSALLTSALDVYLSFPSFLITLALVFIWGNVGIVNGALDAVSGGALGPVRLLETQWGVILAEVTYFTPFVVRPVLAALQVMDRAHVEVAESLGAGGWRIVGTIILPEVLPALLAGGSLVLMRTMNEFGIVMFTGAKGVTTLPTLVYGQAIARGNYDVAAIAALVNIVLSLALYVVYRGVAARAIGGARHAR